MQFSDIITFTRSTGGGRFNAQGQYEWLPANQPRFDFDPVTGEAKGLLIEEQRTNLLQWSEGILNWSNYNLVLTADAARAPDGASTAEKLAADTSNNGHSIQLGFAAVLNNTYSCSFFAKAAGLKKIEVSLSGYGNWTGSNGGRAVFDLSLGTVAWTGSAGISLGIEDVGEGWYRCHIVVKRIGADSYSSVAIGLRDKDGNAVFTGNGVDGVYVWGVQLEVGSFPTSYIPTTTAQVTRAADIASVNELSPWYRADEGTLFVEFSRQWESSPFQGRVAYLSGADTTKVLQIRVLGNGAAAGTITDAGIINADIQSAVLPISSSRVALAWGAAGASMAANGLLPGVDGSVVIPQGLTTLWLGNSFGGAQLMGHIRSIRYFPRRLSNSELQAITS